MQCEQDSSKIIPERVHSYNNNNSNVCLNVVIFHHLCQLIVQKYRTQEAMSTLFSKFSEYSTKKYFDWNVLVIFLPMFREVRFQKRSCCFTNRGFRFFKFLLLKIPASLKTANYEKLCTSFISPISQKPALYNNG